ncbi:hypothetical protein RJ639_006352 [Escallonia herrerae]|uniref:diaminopimelate epimerase n=1 Tax=Escallonia herrerae TaxID=1293975 RepID=A0AA89AVK9_9ASTE|nr:hypothetical protein RJ639_006352 [Escallonia herrerae]
MAIATTISLHLTPPSLRSLSSVSSKALFRSSCSFSVQPNNALRPAITPVLRNPRLCVSASSSMSIEAPDATSQLSFLDRKESGFLHFVKYHGLGNDFILVDNRDSVEPRVTPEQAVKLCDRNFGIGADGVIFVMPGVNGTDYAMRIFNSDGSEPEMCGNGVRCFAKFLTELNSLHGKQRIPYVLCKLSSICFWFPFLTHMLQRLIDTVRVDMGEPILRASDVPTKLPANQDQSVVKSRLNVDGINWNVTCVSMGNPHCVTFGTEESQDLRVDELNLANIGPKFEHHMVFPARTNTEFVQVYTRSHLKMRVWERGAGATLACGTGACAVAVAAVLEGRADRTCTVDLPGGPLEIEWSEEDNHVYMTGPAEVEKMSLTPDQFRKAGMGVAPSPTPFLTPRPERRRADPRGIDWNSGRLDRDREVNVQVLLRCRPSSDDEQRLNVPKVITCNEQKREVTVLQNLANKQVDKVFTFDKVFGPKAQQRSIYDQAISPIVNEVLEGFNCTVFAYGQTGTGKTYTMEGGMRNKGGDLPAEAGVIPRAVRQIFDILEAQNADYSMKVTFLELYNEEITDLLAPEDCSRSLEERQKKPVSLMEDGKGCVIVRGLEEEVVYSANEIYSLLERGASRRRTADTLLNKRSSRSHSVFTITIHVKEATVGNEELIKCGKLNLVDLAGSENISRSGSREGRAREAGEINKSLLTLGRVINALVEHSLHVPYRDSKLTRLLRDSLGGKTKTCIIATISPSAHCLEETLSTLDYAYRAKNIKNKPEANQKVAKAVLLKDLYVEIERMKQDVRAAREKNGVYIPHERYSLDEAEKKAKNEKIEKLEIDIHISEKQVDKFRELYLSEQEGKLNIESELKGCKINLESCNNALQDLQEKYRTAISVLKEKEFVISKLMHSDQKSRLETENQGMLLTFGSQLDQSLKDLHKTILGSVSQQQQHLRCMEEHACSFLASKCDATQVLESKIKKMAQTYTLGLTALKELADSMQMKASSDLEQIKFKLLSHIGGVEDFVKTATLEAKDVLFDIQNSLDGQKQLLAFSAQQQEEGLRQTLVLAEVFSRVTLDFFNDLNHRASKLMTVVEENQLDKSHHLATFEKMFKEETARDEQQAMENIAAILANLTAKRTAMVSEASRNIQDTSFQEKKILLQEMFSMQKVSADAMEELNIHNEKVKSHFFEDTFSSAEIRATMENCLKECDLKSVKLVQSSGVWFCVKVLCLVIASLTLPCSTSKVDYSKRQWDNAYSFINQMSARSIADTEAMLNMKPLHCADSLVLDHETKRELDSMSSLYADQLKSVREKHGQSILDIRNRAEQCLKKDYLIDQHTSTTPRKRVIVVPSLSSIEAMKTPASEELIKSIGSLNKPISANESKIQQQQLPCVGASPNRSPFTEVN